MACLWLFVAAACGGRTLDESNYDHDGSGANGGNGVTGGKGGRSGVGGSPGTSGGVTGSGGAATTPKESCRRLCKQLIPDCGGALGVNDEGCRSSCEQGFAVGASVSSSPACDALRIAALACVENALAQPGATCNDFRRIITQDCVVPLALVLTCGQ